MSWISSQLVSGGVASNTNNAADDWLNDVEGEEGSKDLEVVDPMENLRRKFETLGQNEGLERGMRDGEQRGMEWGYCAEAGRAFAFGRVLGAAKATVAVMNDAEMTQNLAQAVHRAEAVARGHWVDDPGAVDDAVRAVREELSIMEVNLPEWAPTGASSAGADS